MMLRTEPAHRASQGRYPHGSMAKKPATTKELSADCRFVILHGKEAYIRLERTSQLRDALAKAFGGVDTVTFNGSTTSAADVLDECRSFGLIAQHKLVIVE